MNFAFDYVHDKGLTLEMNYAYTGKDGTCKSAGTDRDVHVSTYSSVPSGDCDQLKARVD